MAGLFLVPPGSWVGYQPWEHLQDNPGTVVVGNAFVVVDGLAVAFDESSGWDRNIGGGSFLVPQSSQKIHSPARQLGAHYSQVNLLFCFPEEEC